MNDLVSLFHWILDASLRASVLSVAVLLVQAALRSIVSARWRYALWLPVLLVLMLPVLPRSRWSAESFWAPRPQAAGPSLQTLPMTAVNESAPALPQRSISQVDWKTKAACIVWAAGSALSLAGGLGWYIGTLRRFAQNATQTDETVSALINTVCTELRLKRRVRVITSPVVESPAVTGLVRPVLLLPSGFPGMFSREEARLVLKHELTHIKRCDVQINAVVLILNSLHWFNPVLWLAAWRSRQDREAACDAQVLGSEPCDRRAEYGNALLKVQSTPSVRWISVGLVGIFAPGSVLRARIEAIARYKQSGPMGAIAAGAAILLLGISGATHAQVNQPESGITKAPSNQATPSVLAKSQTATELIALNKNKLDRLIIPQVDFHAATLPEVVDFVKQKSIALDITESDPSRRGLNIVMELTGTAVPAARVTLSMTNKSLGEVLQAVCQSAGYRLKIDPYAVILALPSDPDVMITKEYKMAPLDGKETATDFLKANGIASPAGASAAYFKSWQRLVVHNTEVNIDLIDPVVVKWNAQHPHSSAPAAATPAPGSFQSKLQKTVIPKIEFREMTVNDAVEYLKQQSAAVYKSEPDASKRGVNIVLKGNPNGARLTLALTDVPLITAIRYVAQLSGLKVQINAGEVWLL